MCGINGIINNNRKEKSLLRAELAKMNQLIFHRGPDDNGFYIDSSDQVSVGMAMRRLAIIDLSTGKQPMYTNDNNMVIVFNGEIYNYRVLKQQMENSGVTFKTNSDTEVILKLYELKGVEAFKELDGMYAFSIHDKTKNKVFIARDFFGEKPLYYTKTETDFIYGSELKSIVSCLTKKPTISKEGLNLYFRLTYIPAPHTIYENIFKLPSNHYIAFDITTDKFSIHEIEKSKPIEKNDISFDTAKKEVYTKVMESVESRSVADVSLGSFLSGGVDSSVVTHCLAEISNEKVETFSIGFEKKDYDETDKSKVVAKLVNSNHHEFIVKEEDFKNGIDEILLNFDEPFADSSALPTYLVSKHASDHVKVALTGDGGDEVFGGYNKYYMGKLNNKYTSVVPKFIHKQILNLSSGLLNTKDDNRGKRFRLNRLLNAFNYEGNQYWNIISLAFTDQEKTQLLKSDKVVEDTFAEFKERYNQQNPKNITDFRMVDKNVSLEGDMLVKVDRTSMLNSLECRAPFLNKSIWDLTNSLPENYLLKGWNKKYILKEAFADKFPPNFLNKSKQGFGVPVGDWLRGSLRPELESYIEPKFLESQGLFNYDYLYNLVNKHISGKEDKSMQVWCFYTFQKWYLNIYLMLNQ